MTSLSQLSFLIFFGASLAAGGALHSQDAVQEEPKEPQPDPAIRLNATIGQPVRLEVSRRFLKNFLTDDDALVAYESADGDVRDFSGAFTVGSPGARYVAIWDPTSCRLVGVLDLRAPSSPVTADEDSPQDPQGEDAKASSPYVLRAAGPAPFQNSAGVFGAPEYFGFRIDAGRPVFLYIHGGLVVEESLWFEDGGKLLRQRFVIRDPGAAVTLTYPDPWREIATVDQGEWDGSKWKVEKEAAADFSVSFDLEEARTPEEEPEEESQ